MATRLLAIAADHPAYAGHFPGEPVLPGVVLLDEVVRILACAGPLQERASAGWQIAAAKFSSPVRPGEPLELSLEPAPGILMAPGGSQVEADASDSSTHCKSRFVIRAAGRIVASGTLSQGAREAVGASGAAGPELRPQYE